jgi:tetratricopeptide (TPR) repeat protein
VEGEDGAQAAVLNLLLGQSKNDQAQYRQAEAYLRESLRLDDHYEFRAQLIARKELATALSGQGKFAEAEAIFGDVLAQSEASNGRDSPAQTGYLVAIARHYRRAGTIPLSLEYAERANAIVHAGPLDWGGALAVEQYGYTLREAGRHAESLAALREAHAALKATFGSGDPRVSRLAAAID